MADDPENIALVYLRRFDEKLDRFGDDIRELKGRMTALVESLVGLQRRVDRFDLRLDRVENRLDLVELPR